MTPPTWTLFLYQAVLLAAAFLSLPCLFLYRNRWMNRAGELLVMAITVLWIARLAVAGHLPMFGAYESSLSLAFFSGIVLVSQARNRPVLSLYPPVAAALLYHGYRYSPAVYALTISERGFWVHLHAVIAFLTFALAVLLLALSLLALMKHEVEIKKVLLTFYLSYTLTIISGSIYEFLLFGKVWSFDPIETMNLACFFAFTTLVHMVSFQNWTSVRTARWTVFCCLLLVLAFRLILIFPPESTYHIFDIDLRIHIVR